MSTLALLGCATTGSSQRCLQTPVSSKVAGADLMQCETALLQQPKRRDLYQRLMRLLLAKGRYRDVMHWSHQIVAADERRADAAYYLAVSLRKLERCADAVPFYQLYAKRHADDPDPHYAIGLCLESLGKPASAREAYAKYLELEKRPEYGAWRERADARMAALAKERPPKPARAKATSPDSSSASNRPKIPIAQKVGSAPVLESAAAEPRDCSRYARSVTKDPFATSAYEQLATCLRLRGQHERIVRFMRIALRDNPDWSRGWLHLGRAQRALGESKGAKTSLRKACDGGVSKACR